MAGLHKTSKCLIFIVVPRNFEKVKKQKRVSKSFKGSKTGCK